MLKIRSLDLKNVLYERPKVMRIRTCNTYKNHGSGSEYVYSIPLEPVLIGQAVLGPQDAVLRYRPLPLLRALRVR